MVGSFSASFSGYADSTLTVLGTEGRLALEDAFVPRRQRRLVVDRGARTTLDGVGGGEVSGTSRTSSERRSDGDEVREEFDYFAHCVLAGTTPEPDGHDGLRDVRVMDAVYEAAGAGERVDL